VHARHGCRSHRPSPHRRGYPPYAADLGCGLVEAFRRTPGMGYPARTGRVKPVFFTLLSARWLPPMARPPCWPRPTRRTPHYLTFPVPVPKSALGGFSPPFEAENSSLAANSKGKCAVVQAGYGNRLASGTRQTQVDISTETPERACTVEKLNPSERMGQAAWR
jgi:hypothetical protein